MGSVKDLEVIQKPTEASMGVGRFHFSDRYSVFDWGEMPDQIDAKGAALCLMGAYCFEKLEDAGIKTHYKGLVGPNGALTTFKEIRQPSNDRKNGIAQLPLRPVLVSVLLPSL